MKNWIIALTFIAFMTMAINIVSYLGYFGYETSTYLMYIIFVGSALAAMWMDKRINENDDIS